MRRRDLLLAAGYALPVAAAAAAGRDQQPGGSSLPDKPVGIAIVGLGNYARVVIERTRGARGAALTALVSGDRSKAVEIARANGVARDAVYDYGSFGRIANDERVAAVHICLPVGLHAEYVERALDAGKHVLCEKPLAESSATARRLARLAQSRNLILMPAYRAWFSAHLQELRRRIIERTHGALVAIDAHKGFRMQLPTDNWRFDPVLAGGGSLYDIGIYSVQLCRWLAAGLPRRVAAVLTTDPAARSPSPVDDHVAFTLEFPERVIATGTASWRYRLQNRACVATADAWLSLDPATPVIGEKLTVGLERPNRIEELLLPPQDQLLVMYQHFAECVRARTAPSVTAQDGIDDLVIMEAIYRAAREERWTAVEASGAAI